MVALAALLMLCLLSIVLTMVLVSMVGSLLTGRRPAVFTTFTRFHQASQQFRQGIRPGHGASAPEGSADVVDVQAHEVRQVLAASERPPTTGE
ncbi:MAG: hypothetical protein A3F78_17060 [Burkholderiales bacterium RIFCSPLOWO2_12_FULL_61_40]|nr:MAG: hypothetical protein A3F78_17060 [Burkholderiales bacterium RIFCSPLOWO2_12_FULL_61_40]